MASAVPDESVNPEETDAFARTRRSIIDHLGDWADRTAWDRFYRTYWKVIHAFAVKHGLRNDEAFDVVQETVLAIARQSQQRRYEASAGSFKNWLFQQTRWRIADQFRRRGREVLLGEAEPGGTPPVERMPDGADPDAVWEAEWKSNTLQIATERVRAQVAPKQFQIFELSAVKEWPVKEVRTALGVSAAQIYLARHRVGALLKKEIGRIDRETLQH